MFRGRFWISLCFGIGAVSLAVIVNPPITLPIAVMVILHMALNQPYPWMRLFKANPRRLVIIHLYLDIIIATTMIHLFGGILSGPLIAVYVLIMFHASMAVHTTEGLRAGLVSLALFFLVVFLEREGIISRQPSIFIEGGGFLRTLALILTTIVVFLVPAFAGQYVYRILIGQERELRRTLARAQRIFDDSRDVLLIIDHQGSIIRGNPRAADFFGKSPNDLSGMSLASLLSPEAADDFAVFIQDASTGEQVAGKNLPLKLGDGTERIVEIIATIYEREPHPPGTFIVMRDETERHRLQEELRRYSEELYRRVEDRTAELEESRETYASLFEKAAVPLCWLDPYGILQSANKPFLQLTGLDSEAQGKLRLVEIISSEHMQDRVAGYLDLHRKGYDAPTRLDLEITKQDGSRAYSEWFVRFEPLTDQILISMIEITERKKAEQDLKESEKRFRQLFDRVFDAIIMSSETAQIIDANEAATRLLGYSREEFTGMSMYELVSQRYLEGFIEAGRRVLESGIDQTDDLELVTRDGEPRTVEAGAVRVEISRKKYIIGSFRDITERKKAETALKESEERYRRLVETSPDAITVTDLQGRIIMVNQQAVDLYGAETEDELLGKNSFDLIHIDSRDRAVDGMMKTLESGSVRNIEYDFLRKDGSYYPGDISASLIRDSGGKPLAFIGVIRDITERKKTEEELARYRKNLEEQVSERTAELERSNEQLLKEIEEHRQTEDSLRRSEERYRALFDRSLDCVYIYDFDGNIIDANPASLRLLGYGQEEVRSLNFEKIFPPEEIPRVAKAAEEVIKSGHSSRVREFWLRRKDGSLVQVEAISSVIYRGDKPYAIQGVARDITERKKSEQELRESEERYQALFERSLDAVFINDFQGTFIDANPEALRLLGYQKDEIKGLNYARLVSGDQLTQALEAMEEIIRTGSQKKPLELRLTKKNGDYLFVETKGSLIYREGKPYAIQGIARDITERMRAEKALKESEENYRLHFENVTDVIFSIDRDYRLVSVSSSVEKHLGYPPDQLRGRPFQELEILAPEYTEKAYKEINRIFSGESISESDAEFIARDGTRKFACISGSPLYKNGEVVHVICVARDVTQRKKAEMELEKYRQHLEDQVIGRTAELSQINERLRESEKKYRSLFQDTSDAVYMTSREGTIIDVNGSASRMSGYSREELIGMNALELYADPEQRRKFMAKAEKTGAVTDFELEFVRKDKKHVFGLISSSVRYGEDGSVIGYQGIIRDITERKLAEQAVRESEERYRLLAENVSDVIWISDLDLKVTYLSPSVERVRGFTVEEAMNMSPGDSMTPQSYQMAMETLAGELDQEKSKKGDPKRVYTLEIELYKKDGSTMWTEMRTSFLRDNEGKAIGILGVNRDITERKKAQESLEWSEKHFRALTENSQDIISVLDHRGNIIYESPSVERALGFKPEELVGRNSFEFVHPDDRKELLDRFQTGLDRPGRTISTKFRIRDKKGNWKTFEVTATNLVDDPVVGGFVVNSRDITERKEMEKAQEELMEQLIQARQMAAAGQMAAGITHEMNSPLTAISYYSETLEKSKKLEKEDKEKIQQIREAGQRIKELLNGLVNYASADTAELREVDMNSVVRQVLDAIAHELEMRPKAQVTTRLSKSLPAINGSPDQLYQLVSNLVINALQSLPKGRGKVSISTRVKKDIVELVVKDNGAGIAEQDIECIFNPFFSRRPSGTGLGLSIVQRIARMHEGDVSVQSQPRKGATFRVRLPVAPPPGKKK